MKEIRISSYHRSTPEFEEVKSWLEDRQEEITGSYDRTFEYYWARMPDELHLLFKLRFGSWGEII